MARIRKKVTWLEKIKNVKLAQGCNKNKVPYFLSTENRYSWSNPCEHDWVRYEYSKYDMSKVYDISYEN